MLTLHWSFVLGQFLPNLGWQKSLSCLFQYIELLRKEWKWNQGFGWASESSNRSYRHESFHCVPKHWSKVSQIFCAYMIMNPEYYDLFVVTLCNDAFLHFNRNGLANWDSEVDFYLYFYVTHSMSSIYITFQWCLFFEEESFMHRKLKRTEFK